MVRVGKGHLRPALDLKSWWERSHWSYFASSLGRAKKAKQVAAPY